MVISYDQKMSNHSLPVTNLQKFKRGLRSTDIDITMSMLRTFECSDGYVEYYKPEELGPSRKNFILRWHLYSGTHKRRHFRDDPGLNIFKKQSAQYKRTS